ncbi:MAG: hypothetical protein N3A69_12070 [Leptospiraceae bacterium]|nr:hypothetical protein [Leptospiraceae bacterium]
MKHKIFLYIVTLLYLLNCKSSAKKEEQKTPEVIENKKIAAKVEEIKKEKEPFFIPTEPPPPLKLFKFYRKEDWERVPEGFLDSATFQVKVSSLKVNQEEAIQEATEVGKRKAVALMQNYAFPNLSPEGKVELKILAEEFGKLVAESDLIDDRRLFVFQVKRPALEIIVKEKLK